jgi:hypothetical protein
MFPAFWSHEVLCNRAFAEILINQQQILRNQEKHMSALKGLQDAVTKLQADVTAFIAANTGGASDAELTALTAQVAAIDAAINPPVPPVAG